MQIYHILLLSFLSLTGPGKKELSTILSLSFYRIYNRLFVPFEKNSRTRKLRPQENNSKLKSKKLKVPENFGKITTNLDPNKGENTQLWL